MPEKSGVEALFYINILESCGCCVMGMVMLYALLLVYALVSVPAGEMKHEN